MFKLLQTLVIAGLITTPAHADEVIGAIWQVKNNVGYEWQFRAGPKGVLWTVPDEGLPKRLGTWSANGPRTVLKFDAPREGTIGAKRTITIVQVGKRPPKWQGESELPNGRKFTVTVTLIKD
ncbi:hypothetical protein [Lignipirellula cremea]|uniref:Chagasin family peptidase inhibitor I42 n=1 Tax=Lignipirellula cremea TaxID=2528010 RepID=A0A518E1M2_9BACT|nr:hypothetical protein [Lignipirellula cremea]QDU97996.1 hypothetical protein Pla8534_58570 [Lignipirellula cremea]